VPDGVMGRLASVPPEAQKEEGLRIALEIVEAVREIPGISGIHLMTINHEEAIPSVVQGAGLLPRPAPSDVTIA
jgi:5,10-methylenetetrahydrofolate reductase